MIRIGIVAGEPSGDNLGANLIADIKSSIPDVIIEGIGGENLISQGCHSLYPMERLSVMGLFEIAGRYFELLGMQRHIKQHFLENPPDIFIGIDAPEFTLPIEKTLRKAGIKTVHYVSPSVWAWRQYRLKGIAKSTDFMMTLFPFEEYYYERHNIPVKCVGHPLAKQIPIKIDQKNARQELQLSEENKLLALLPGSRKGEISRLSEPFILAAEDCLRLRPDLKVIVALRDRASCELFQEIKARVAPKLDIRVYENKTQLALAASDLVLLASGTATLEAMLMKKPMVVAYKANWFTYKIIMSLLTIPYVSLPNLIAEEKLVPELLQSECQPEKLSKSLMSFLDNKEKTNLLIKKFTELHKALLANESDSAANVVLKLLS